MRLVYMGTPAAAVPPLAAIKAVGHDVIAVVCQPDRPKGRGKETVPGEVKKAALSMGLRVMQPERANDPRFVEELASMAPDAVVVMAYGQKIPKAALDIPRHGFINIHASLLPEYRGAAPVQRALMDGKSSTGVTIMYMNEGMDEGDVGLVREIPILPDDDSGSVMDKVSAAGSELIVRMLRLLDKGEAPRKPQDPSKASTAGKITRGDETIDWGRGKDDVVNLVRALAPDPGARTKLGGNEMKVLKARALDDDEAAQLGLPANRPGLAFAGKDSSAYASASNGWVEILMVRPSGGRTMDCRAFVRGRRLTGETDTEYIAHVR